MYFLTLEIIVSNNVKWYKSDTMTDKEDFTHKQPYKIIEYNPISFIAGF